MTTISRIFRNAFGFVVPRPSKEVLGRLTTAVSEAEKGNSGEVRLVVEHTLPLGFVIAGFPIRERALWHFANERVWDTEANSGVLVYVLLSERCLEIVADRGINSRVVPSYWNQLSEHTIATLTKGNFENAITNCLHKIGSELRTHFPLKAGAQDLNEMTDAPQVV